MGWNAKRVAKAIKHYDTLTVGTDFVSDRAVTLRLPPEKVKVDEVLTELGLIPPEVGGCAMVHSAQSDGWVPTKHPADYGAFANKVLDLRDPWAKVVLLAPVGLSYLDSSGFGDKLTFDLWWAEELGVVALNRRYRALYEDAAVSAFGPGSPIMLVHTERRTVSIGFLMPVLPSESDLERWRAVFNSYTPVKG